VGSTSAGWWGFLVVVAGWLVLFGLFWLLFDSSLGWLLVLVASFFL
jgi:hypothetical protein